MGRRIGRRVLMSTLVVSCVASPAAAEQLEEILVTGSRIPYAPGADMCPVLVLERSDLRHLGAEALGTVLQRLPLGAGTPVNTGVNAAGEQQGGDGSTRIDLRGLGVERTLVLVDGRRFVAGGLGGDASVDLGMIPLTLVERVEVLGAGSSAVYGADAIGGVVNVLTRRGAAASPELTLSGSISSRGDGGSVLAAIAGNRPYEGGIVSGGVEWYGQQAVWMRDRDYSRVRETLLADGSVIPLGLAQTPQGFFRVPRGNRPGLSPGVYTRVEGSGEPTTAEDFRPFVEPDDRYNPNADEYLRTPLDRWSVWLDGEHTLGDATRVGWSGWLHRRRSEQVLRPAPLDTRFGIGMPVLAGGLPGIPTNNLYNPFGIDLRDVRRRLVEAGRRQFKQDVEAARLVATLEGRGNPDWSWELAVGWSRNDTGQTTSGELRADRTVLALGPSGFDDAGWPVCGTPDPGTGLVTWSDIVVGCVPLNVFGGQGPDGLGTVDEAQIAYVTDRYRDHGRNEQWIADAGAHGKFGELAAGPIGWAVGAELRREEGFRRPDPDKLAGVSGAVTGDLAGGRYDVAEAYGELRLPLLARRPGIERLDVDVGLRWSDFSTFGSASSLSGRLGWQPRRGLIVRGAYSEVFRAPTLASLYTSPVYFLGIARDPCGNEPDPGQRVNCAANGVPGGSYEQSLQDQIPTIRGGSSDLRPEEGRSWSAGLAWASGGDALALSIDYFDTLVRAAIRQLLNQTLLDECANTGAPSVCGRITRWPDGTVREVDARYLNLGSELASGIDLEARYRFIWHGGSGALRLATTHLDDRSITTAAGSPPLELAGSRFERSLYPRWRGLGGVDFARGVWSAGYVAEYLGSVRECRAGLAVLPDELTGCRDISGVLYHDLRLAYVPRGGWSVSALVTNVTDEDPPRVAFVPAEGNTSTANYRLLGRTISLQLQYGGTPP